jgi:hypothetical protein
MAKQKKKNLPKDKRLQKKLEMVRKDYEGQKSATLEMLANKMLKHDEKMERLAKREYLEIF